MPLLLRYLRPKCGTFSVIALESLSYSRESIGREAKLLLLTEIRATAAPLAAQGVTSWLSAVNKR